MSVRIMTAVWKLEDISATDKLVLLKLADCCDDDGRNAFPSQKTIARQCGMKDRTVRLALSRLLRRGYVRVQAERTNKRPATYAVVIDGAERDSTLEGVRAERDSTQGRRVERVERNVVPVGWNVIPSERNVVPAGVESDGSALKERTVLESSGTIRESLDASRRDVFREGKDEKPNHEVCCEECDWSGTGRDASAHYRKTRHAIRVNSHA